MPKVLSHFNSIIAQLCLYADDFNLLLSAKILDELERAAQIHLSNIYQYLLDNDLILNCEKTNFMSFLTKQNKNIIHPQICIDNNTIDQIENTKFLGLHFDINLSWNKHIDHIIKRISSGLYALKRMSFFCELSVLKTIFYAHIQSHISYGIGVYGATSNKNLDRILILQKKAIRIMLKLKQDDSVKQYFSELQIFTVYGLYIFECIMHVKQQQQTNIQTLNTKHTHNTRFKNNVILPRHNLEFYKKKTSYAGAFFLRALPKSIADIEDSSKFRRALKDHIISKSLYSFEEFSS